MNRIQKWGEMQYVLLHLCLCNVFFSLCHNWMKSKLAFCILHDKCVFWDMNFWTVHPKDTSDKIHGIILTENNTLPQSWIFPSTVSTTCQVCHSLFFMVQFSHSVSLIHWCNRVPAPLCSATRPIVLSLYARFSSTYLWTAYLLPTLPASDSPASALCFWPHIVPLPFLVFVCVFPWLFAILLPQKFWMSFPCLLTYWQHNFRDSYLRIKLNCATTYLTAYYPADAENKAFTNESCCQLDCNWVHHTPFTI